MQIGISFEKFQKIKEVHQKDEPDFLLKLRAPRKGADFLDISHGRIAMITIKVECQINIKPFPPL